ncbi:MAG: tRNA (N6-threonylcarbamoyladenosine(37)-N6)-methyltransferase TrmO [Methanocorpusculum sp.]|nr:tRNA (N6-threonylcarbamoyladenosine(37)-N6)-methyltransferase TrmO [Methanocorpusculum sp.]
MVEILCTPIGTVSSPYKEKEDAPRQGCLANDISIITLGEAYVPAATSLKAGDDIFVLCWFDRADRSVLLAQNRLEKPPRGVFSLRSPSRPNPISLTLVRLMEIEGNTLTVRGLEALDGTPVLDIKPYYDGIDEPQKEGVPVMPKK